MNQIEKITEIVMKHVSWVDGVVVMMALEHFVPTEESKEEYGTIATKRLLEIQQKM